MAKVQQDNEQLKTLIEDVLSFGDMLLIANKGIGKTNALMVLAEQFRALPDTRLIIFEDFPKWSLEFSEMPFMIIRDEDVVENGHTIDVEDYFLRHERTYAVKRGSEIESALENNKHLIFTSEIQDIERQAFFIYSIVQYFYRRAYLRRYKNYHKRVRIIFSIEESQNVFDSSTISKALFNRLGKIFSVARNLDLHFVLCSQRLQDLNTKIRGRTRLLIGSVSLDDYELKIHRLLRHSKHRDEMITLEKGSFLYTYTDEIIRFPKFEPKGFPYKYAEPQRPQTEQKPRGIRAILRAWLKTRKEPKPQTEPKTTEQTEPSEPEPDEDLDEQLEQEDEETLGLLGEPDEEW